jgi:ketosteroid isomerase-like protein
LQRSQALLAPSASLIDTDLSGQQKSGREFGEDVRDQPRVPLLREVAAHPQVGRLVHDDPGGQGLLHQLGFVDRTRRAPDRLEQDLEGDRALVFKRGIGGMLLCDTDEIGVAMLSLVTLTLMRRVYRDATRGRFGLIAALAADDVVFVFPGSTSFSGTFHGKQQLLEWLSRFATLAPRIEVLDAAVAGPPWNMRVTVRLDDSIGPDYHNRVMELLHMRWGRLRRLEVFLDTELLTAWETRHPELVTGGDTGPAIGTVGGGPSVPGR